eukprot:jgi/Chlat1/132/Chrsp1S03227
MAEIQGIVERLNAPPFSLDFTLVTFSNKTPEELKQLLNDVFATISQVQKVDLRDEVPEQTAARMHEFLHMLEYQPPHMDGALFRQALAEGQQDTIYQILSWALPQLPDLEKRAYMGRFLVDVEIPPELCMDPEIADAREAIAMLQEQFKEAYNNFETVRKTSRDPAEIKKQISLLEEEREKLTERIAKTRAKLQAADAPNLDKAQEVAVQLRKEQEAEVQLREQHAAQSAALQRAEVANHRAAARLREARADSSSSGNASALLTRLAHDTDLLRYTALDKLPREVERKEARLQALQQVMDDPVSSESDLAQLQAELNAMNAAINSLTDVRRTSNSNNDGGKAEVVRQQAQMAALVARKKEAAFARLEEVSRLKEELWTEVDERSARALHASNRQGENSAALQELTGTYRQMKAELDRMRGQYGELAHKEHMLQQQQAQLAGIIEQLDLLGPGGKSIDASQIRTADDFARTSQDMAAKTRERKAQLAPQVKELRGARQRHQEFEADYEEKKKAHEEQARAIEGKRGKLDQEVGTLRTEFTEDKQQRDGRGMSLAASLREKYEAKIAAQEERAKILRERQRALKEVEKPNLGQVEMMRDLQRIMSLKLKLYKDEKVDKRSHINNSSMWGMPSNAGTPGTFEVNEMKGANRLVLDP